ncbi:hypothetical protein [Pedobacter zeae]|uniref:Tetratricopeptide (TPR) repeat protein n=1 Tax=Pedobacter zeae TaxID=1737356 RepID=A0A7W6KE59_9SPHI|nr:hypothetical protein [Pedobacter zeae]MBB4110160.1 tetratricopeptide (TPR) repeat protein [Pedobacter zeae]GGH16389.1 hypothetical protein GCM10007422_39070 [Pedobacter zeae]
MNTNDLLIELRKFVLIKSGLRNIDPAHCKIISEYVFQETKNYVSETTIKRFFGFANTLHKFSLFTLNSLSQYIGYNDWDSFCKDKENQTTSVQSIWQDLRLKAHAITEISLIAQKNNSGVPFNATANRSFFYPDFDYFLKNNYQFTTISAQPGQGKSILLAHMVEYFFLSENALYKNDIVLMINSTSINTIIQNGDTLKDWFLKEFKFGSLSELISFFKKNPEKREGRFIIIVDGIDEHLGRSNYFKTFIDFLYSIEENSFVKLVFGLRTNSWINLQPAIYGSASLTKAWYTGLFYDQETLSNVPSLNADEVLYTLSHIENKIINRADVSTPLLTQFKTPFWLQVYFKLKEENHHLELSNPLLCYELISYFLEKRVFLAKKSTEKVFLLKKISDCISEGNKKLRVSKEKILSYINCYPDAYEELLHAGIIIEEKRLSTTIPTEIVRFLNDDIYTYFLFIQITDKFDYKPCKLFFEHILSNFPGQTSLRDHILNWAIRFCITRNEISALKNIFRLPFANSEKNKAFDFICYVSKYELSKPNSNFNKLSIGIDFIDIMASGRTMSNLYKETIKTISENVLNEDVQIMLHIIECNVNLIDVDKIALANTMQLLKRNYKRLNELFPINPYDLILYFYNNLVNKPNESKTLEEKIVKLCQEIDQSKPQKNEEITSAEILSYRLVLITLFSQKSYAECHRFIMAILSKYPNIFYVRYSVFSPFLLLHLGQTYIKLNYFKKAQRIIQFVDKIISSDYTYYTNFILAGFSVLKANFYNATNNYEQALIETNTGLAITAKNNFKMFEISLLLNKIEILKHTEESEEVSNVIKELLNFLTVHKLSMPDYSNLSSHEFEHTFKILKSYRRHQNL